MQWSVASASSIGGNEWAYFSAVRRRPRGGPHREVRGSHRRMWRADVLVLRPQPVRQRPPRRPRADRADFDELVRPCRRRLCLFVPAHRRPLVALFARHRGGTYAQAWAPARVTELCTASAPAHAANTTARDNPNQPAVLYNAMIVPFAPMAVRGAIWYQGESNTGGPDSAALYECLLSALIVEWRRLFRTSLPFLWVQLAPWTYTMGGGNRYNVAGMRAAQFRIMQMLDDTAIVTAADLGDLQSPAGNIHPRYKQAIGWRLANAAQAVVYNDWVGTVPFGPVLTKLTLQAANPQSVTVRASFAPYSVAEGLHYQTPLEGCPAAIADKNECAWWELQTSDGVWHNATFAISPDRRAVDVTIALATAATDGPRASRPAASVSAARFGWGDYPVVTIYNSAGLPVFPFSRTLDAASAPLLQPAAAG